MPMWMVRSGRTETVLFLEEISVSPSALERHLPIAVIEPDQQPIRFDVAFPSRFPILAQTVYLKSALQLFPSNNGAHNLLEFCGILATLSC